MTLTHAEALRFIQYIRVTPEGCWEWTGGLTHGNGDTKDPGGYPKFWLRGKTVLAHRVMFRAVTGRDADTVDHTCRNRACVRFRCFDDVPIRINILRGTSIVAQNAVKTHCIHGHLIDGTQAKGRECRTCRREIYKRYRERRRQGKCAVDKTIEAFL